MKAATLAAALLAATEVQAERFFESLQRQGVTFQVESPNDASINPVNVKVRTAERSLDPVTTTADGSLTHAEIADLNRDGIPELYISISSAGSGSYGSLIAYTLNPDQSLAPIALPPLAEDPEASAGYIGHDSFAVGEGSLLRRFPIYLEGDMNARPTGGHRQIEYRLVSDDSGWHLRIASHTRDQQ